MTFFSEKAHALCEAYMKASFLKPLDNNDPLGKFVDGSQLYQILEEVRFVDFAQICEFIFLCTTCDTTGNKMGNKTYICLMLCKFCLKIK